MTTIRYRFFGAGMTTITTRQPVIIPSAEKLCLCFDGKPEEATTAILQAGAHEMYLTLTDACAVLQAGRLSGNIKVTLAAIDSSARPQVWKCEEISTTPCEGGILIAPNDMNMPERFTELKKENEEIRAELGKVKAEISALQNRIERMLEGYDLV